MESVEAQLATLDQRSKSNTHRIDKLEASQEAITQLATSVAVMAETQKHTADSIDRLSGEVQTVAGKVDTLEKIPAKRWEFVIEKAIYIIVAALLGYVLARVGLSG